jgi:hypothetical protein
MDRIDDLLVKIRDPRACGELLLAAPGESAGHVAQQLAAVLSSLPAVHRELGESSSRAPAVEELVRRIGGLELLLLDIACHLKEPHHGRVRLDDGHRHPDRARGLRRMGSLARL